MIRRLRPLTVLTITMILLAISASVNAVQARRIHVLLSANPSVSKLIGQTGSPLVGFSTSGQPRQEQFVQASLPTVVYYFSRSCKWCELNWPAVQALADAGDARFRLLAVTSDRGLTDYIASHHLTVDILEGLSEESRAKYEFSGTPRTVVVSSEGLITHEWLGIFGQRTQRQIEELFAVSLPRIEVPTDRQPSRK